MNPLKALHEKGQSVWLDYIRADLLDSGKLQKMVEEDGIRGVTSNPTIFQKAIAAGGEYDERIRTLLREEPFLENEELFEKLAVQDICRACDVLRPVFGESEGSDGFVSLEVSPRLAEDTEGTIQEARRLWKEVDRPNLLIKVPATPAGIPAIEALLAEGINVNVTLMFSLDHYEAVARAYINGVSSAREPAGSASVASFFVSRVDTAVDRELEAIGTPEALALRGKTAVANAKLAYKRFDEIFGGAPFAKLAEKGVHVQRPLWASTSTKNPAYSDVLYVEELIGPDTVNTMPPKTVDAFKDHGKAHVTITENVDEAEKVIESVEALGISLRKVTEKLQEEGVDAFSKSYEQLLETIGEKRADIESGMIPPASFSSGPWDEKRRARLDLWTRDNFASRMWSKDFTLWSKEHVPEITDRLGWLELPTSMRPRAAEIASAAQEFRKEGLEHVVLLGMGGSSLAPDVFGRTFKGIRGFPALHVLDSTHPAAIKAVEGAIELTKTAFVVSSKSGTTLETLSLFRYFWDRLGKVYEGRGRRFVAVTDPGTPLEKLAKERGFRKVFSANPEVGGRYSALTHFGLVPAALVGVDVGRLLAKGRVMAAACGPEIPVVDNPGLQLGALLGELALGGRDKVTFVAEASAAALPIWMEQLIAESTGKSGKGIVPVADEPLGAPEAYGDDRFFVHFALHGETPPATETALKKLESAGHPVARVRFRDLYDLGAEFFRWEVAVAAAGAVLGIQPFNQPDVQLAKDLAKKAMADAGKSSGIDNIMETEIDESEQLRKNINSLLESRMPGDYLAIQAYLAPGQDPTRDLQAIRERVRNATGLATTVGYGPRFLHSTGQLHKGGPNIGLFLQLVDDPVESLPVPEQDFTFKELIHAQAIGDYTALQQRERRILRINLGADSGRGLKKILQFLGS